MLITYQGHSQFLLIGADGLRLLMDPYDKSANFPVHPIAADVVTISHGHGDHSHVAKVEGQPQVIKTEGEHTFPGGIARAFPSFHDAEGGRKRGSNLLFQIDMDGLVISHLGDLGHVPDADQLRFLSGTDILLLPVGGFYTINATQAADIVRAVQPHITIPMHYRTKEGGLSNIAEVADFLSLLAPLPVSRQPLLRVTREDLSEQPPLLQLDIEN